MWFSSLKYWLVRSKHLSRRAATQEGLNLPESIKQIFEDAGFTAYAWRGGRALLKEVLRTKEVSISRHLTYIPQFSIVDHKKQRIIYSFVYNDERKVWICQNPECVNDERDIQYSSLLRALSKFDIKKARADSILKEQIGLPCLWDARINLIHISDEADICYMSHHPQDSLFNRPLWRYQAYSLAQPITGGQQRKLGLYYKNNDLLAEIEKYKETGKNKYSIAILSDDRIVEDDYEDFVEALYDIIYCYACLQEKETKGFETCLTTLREKDERFFFPD